MEVRGTNTDNVSEEDLYFWKITKQQQETQRLTQSEYNKEYYKKHKEYVKSKNAYNRALRKKRKDD